MPRPWIGITTARSAPTGSRDRLAAMESYAQAIRLAGGIPIFITPMADEDAADELLLRLDGVVLSGGGDVDPARYHQAPGPRLDEVDERRDSFEFGLASRAIAGATPLLGICRGIQVVNVALGGSLIQDIPSQHPGALDHEQGASQPGQLSHRVAIEQRGQLAQIYGIGEAQVNSYHHQAVGDLAPGLVSTALAPDAVIEAVEFPEHPFAVAVQWHPERLLERPESQRLFEALVRAAAKG